MKKVKTFAEEINQMVSSKAFQRALEAQTNKIPYYLELKGAKQGSFLSLSDGKITKKTKTDSYKAAPYAQSTHTIIISSTQLQMLFIGTASINTKIDNYKPRKWQPDIINGIFYHIPTGSALNREGVTFPQYILNYRVNEYSKYCWGAVVPVIYKELKKVFPIGLISPNGTVHIWDTVRYFPYEFWDMIKRGEPYHKSGPRQVAIDELDAALPAIDCADLMVKRNAFLRQCAKNNIIPWEGERYWLRNIMPNRFCIISDTDKDVVIRLGVQTDEGNILESKRFILSKANGKLSFACRKTNQNYWVSCRQLLTTDAETSTCFIDNLEVLKNAFPQIKYIPDTLKDMGIAGIVSSLQYPIIEKLLKSPLSPCCTGTTRILDFNEFIKDYFGKCSKNTKASLLKFLGLNSYQLEKCGKECQNHHDIVRQVKHGAMMDDISGLDNKSFDILLDTILECQHKGPWSNPIWTDSHKWEAEAMFPGKTYKQYLDFRLSLCKQYLDGQLQVFKLFQDCTYVAGRLINTTAVNELTKRIWRHKNFNQIHYVHEELIHLSAIEQEEKDRQAVEYHRKAFAKRAKELNKYCLTTDDFIIRPPLSNEELQEEGQKQHICIGGYTSRYENGGILLFIRRTEDPNTPLLALEVEQDNIVQIHGLYNAWIAYCAPDAIPTVIAWLKLHNIKCSSRILTNLAQGYCSSSEQLDEKSWLEYVDKSEEIYKIISQKKKTK